jgi:DNA-binding LytR/AlgR family response regulator
MNIKCLIIEDEPIAREVLRDYIGKLDDLEISGEYENALEAISFLKQNRVDLIFLDINMPQLSGIDFLRGLSHSPKTIITTAHREFALEGFELQVLDYLLKPYSFERFFQAIEKYYETLSHAVTMHHGDSPQTQRDYLYVRDNRKTYKLYLSDISLIESKGEYIQVWSGEKKIMTRSSLSGIEKLLPQDQFIRTHHSFIVSVNHISAFTASTVEIGDTEIPISRKYKNLVMKALKN